VLSANKNKELRLLSERISSYGHTVHQRYPTGDVIVSERDLAEQLRKRSDAVATALNLLLSEPKVQRAPLRRVLEIERVKSPADVFPAISPCPFDANVMRLSAHGNWPPGSLFPRGGSGQPTNCSGAVSNYGFRRIVSRSLIRGKLALKDHRRRRSSVGVECFIC
jgi:hypothetical protein